jgi:hypothetical protein
LTAITPPPALHFSGEKLCLSSGVLLFTNALETGV